MKEWRGKQIRGEKSLKPKQPAMCTDTFYQEESLEARNSPKSNKESNCSTENEHKADRNTHRKASLARTCDSVLQINRVTCFSERFALSTTNRFIPFTVSMTSTGDSVLQINRGICPDEVFAQSRTDRVVFNVCARYSIRNDRCRPNWYHFI